jgi:hypothetical protein
MAKKSTSRKIKQVASRAKRDPRTDSNVPVDIGRDPYQVPSSKAPAPTPTMVAKEGTTVYSTGDGIDIEFSTERPDIVKRNAIERAKKVDLKAEIRGIVDAFSKDIDERLKALSNRIEDQMKPLVQTVADIAVAKKELADRLEDFGGNLSVTLGLNDELEPIDISTIFAGIVQGDEIEIETQNEVPSLEDEEVELLAEVAEEVRKPTEIN